MRVARNPVRLALGLVLLVALILPAAMALAIDIPPGAHRYRATLTREAQAAWGLEAPVATFAGQLHQESRWNPEAVSRAGAKGMAQFMPATAKWWCEINDLSEAACQPTSPTWAIRSLVGFDRWLWDRIQERPCMRMWNTLRAYNGGLGYIYKEQRTGQPCEAFRSAASCRENLGYPRRIVNDLEPIYERAGWGGGVCQ